MPLSKLWTQQSCIVCEEGTGPLIAWRVREKRRASKPTRMRNKVSITTYSSTTKYFKAAIFIYALRLSSGLPLESHKLWPEISAKTTSIVFYSRRLAFSLKCSELECFQEQWNRTSPILLQHAGISQAYQFCRIARKIIQRCGRLVLEVFKEQIVFDHLYGLGGPEQHQLQSRVEVNNKKQKINVFSDLLL